MMGSWYLYRWNSRCVDCLKLLSQMLHVIIFHVHDVSGNASSALLAEYFPTNSHLLTFPLIYWPWSCMCLHFITFTATLWWRGLIHDAFVNTTTHVCFAYIFCPEMFVRKWYGSLNIICFYSSSCISHTFYFFVNCKWFWTEMILPCLLLPVCNR